MSDNATTKETSKLLTDASNRLAQWDLWETDYYDKSNRRHNSAKDMVKGLREETSKKTEDQSIEDIEYFSTEHRGVIQKPQVGNHMQ